MGLFYHQDTTTGVRSLSLHSFPAFSHLQTPVQLSSHNVVANHVSNPAERRFGELIFLTLFLYSVHQQRENGKKFIPVGG